MNDSLSGPLMLGFSKEDPGAAARLFRDFAKDNDQLKIAIGAVGGETIAAGDIGKLANLPTRDEAIAQLMSVMQAPITKLARTLNEVPGNDREVLRHSHRRDKNGRFKRRHARYHFQHVGYGSR